MTNGDFATISGGRQNQITGIEFQAPTIGGGQNNVITSADIATIGGGKLYSVASSGSTIGGGNTNIIKLRQHAELHHKRWLSEYGPEPGRQFHHRRRIDRSATIAGGQFNRAGSLSAVGGGANNSATGAYNFIGGGSANEAIGGSQTGAIGGGSNNKINGCGYAVIGGGSSNQMRGEYSVIGGGGGGVDDSNAVHGRNSVIPGGARNFVQGNFSLAAGYRARASHNGSFVWSDNTSETPFTTTNPNQFLIEPPATSASTQMLPMLRSLLMEVCMFYRGELSFRIARCRRRREEAVGVSPPWMGSRGERLRVML